MGRMTWVVMPSATDKKPATAAKNDAMLTRKKLILMRRRWLKRRNGVSARISRSTAKDVEMILIGERSTPLPPWTSLHLQPETDQFMSIL